MTEDHLNQPDSPASRTAIAWVGGIIGVLWVVVYAVSLIPGFLFREVLSKYALTPHGFLPLQLCAYSFLHFRLYDLLYDSTMLIGIVRIAQRCLSFKGFIRVYSLGVLGGGLLLILLAKVTSDYSFWGFSLVSTTLLGAILALTPMTRLYFLGNDLIVKRLTWEVNVICGGLIIIGTILHTGIRSAVEGSTISIQTVTFNVIQMLAFWLVVVVNLPVYAIVILLFAPKISALAAVYWMFHNRVSLLFLLAVLGCFAAGILYGFVERIIGDGRASQQIRR